MTSERRMPIALNPSRTTAVLLAGRVIDPAALTSGDARAILAIVEAEAARLGLQIAACVAGDTTSGGVDRSDAEPLSCRLVVGIPLVAATADVGPTGPVPRQLLEDGLALSRERLTSSFWRQVAAHVSDRPLGHTGAVIRAASGNPPLLAGLALDRAELEAGENGVHLFSFGPLSYGCLAAGTLEPLPSFDDAETAREELVYGADSSQHPHRLAVRGTRVAVADSFGAGSQRVMLDHLPAASELYLLASYD